MEDECLREMTCSFTGHRVLAHDPALKEKLRCAIIGQIENGIRYFGCGGALGFDLLAAQTVLELKTSYPDIRLILVLPCEKQDEKWTRGNRALYASIRERADKVHVLSSHYHNGCMHERNRYLVDHSAFMIAFLRHNRGGTAYTVNYAIKNGVAVSIL